jgi:DNA mismatch repair protein MutS
VLTELEGDRQGSATRPAPRKRKEAPAEQISFFGEQPSPVLDELQKLDIDSMTPLEALTKLYELKKRAEES